MSTRDAGVSGDPLAKTGDYRNAVPPVAHPYEVELPLFRGPLDLLLHLIEQQELDITKVALAQVTDQYLQYLGLLKEIDADTLTDFLVVAAKLVLVKSQALLPRPPASLAAEREEEDVGDQLARQLIVYRQFKAVGQILCKREADHLRSHIRLSSTVSVEPRLQAGEVTVLDLLNAARTALAIRPTDPAVDEVVSPIVVTISQQIEYVRQYLRRRRQVTFSQLACGCASRLEVVVTFIAVLELIKQNQLDVRQDALFGDITIAPLRRQGTTASRVRYDAGSPAAPLSPGRVPEAGGPRSGKQGTTAV